MTAGAPAIADYIRRVPLRQFQGFESCFKQRILPVLDGSAENPLIDMRGVTVALFTAGLYQLFEQQSSQVLRWAEGQGVELWRQMKTPEVTSWLSRFGVNVEDCPDWSKVNTELRHVANVVKHAEGDSSAKLKELRPDLFMYPGIRKSLDGLDASVMNVDSFYRSHAGPVATPLAGGGPYIMVKDFDEYAAAVGNVWAWLADRLDSTETAKTV